MLAEQSIQLAPLPNIHALKNMPWVLARFGQRLQISCIGQRIDVNHAAVGLADELTDQRGADETGATR
jgi:hypothetical protein